MMPLIPMNRYELPDCPPRPIAGHTNADNDRYERMLLLMISGVMRNEADELEQARDERARVWLAQLPAAH